MQTQFGKYELKRPLGSGASGTVYCALDTFRGIEVALKVFDPGVLQDVQMGEVTRGQFMNEAALAGRLSHPHIVSIYEAVMQEESGYVAMEYVPGGNLRKFIRPDGLLPVTEVIQVGFKLCSALDYAFRQGIIHRDIKPANILIAQDTNIKLADFGSALLRTAETSEEEMLVGTPSYMSPEQISGIRLTHHSDMYALGVVLYELLTGERPFTAGSIEELFQKIASQAPRAPGAVRLDVPPRLDEIILKMMSKRPEDRYPTWADVALALAQVGKLGVYRHEIADSEKIGYLRKSELFGRLNDAHLWEIVHKSRWNRVAPGTIVLREGEPGQSMFLLCAGELSVTKRGRVLNVLRAGECFGEMAVIQGADATRQATIEATTESLIGEFDPSALARLSEGCRLQIAHGLLRTLVQRLSLANLRISRFA